MKNFELYEPLDHLKSKTAKPGSSVDFGMKHMVLDGVTLANLDITENSSTGTLEGTLLQRLDMCYTPFGKTKITVVKSCTYTCISLYHCDVIREIKCCLCRDE